MIATVPFHDFIARVRLGDEDAARELVRQFEKVIRREVRLRLDDHRLYRVFDSMDISQSVLTSFFARASTGHFDLETPDQLVKLLIKMTRNKVAFQVRRQRALRRDSRMTDARPVDEIDVASPSPGPSELASDHDLIEAVRNRLGDEERRLADLRGEGWEWPEIAARLGGSAQARRVQLARAVQRVAREMNLEGCPGMHAPVEPAILRPRPMVRLGGPTVPPSLPRRRSRGQRSPRRRRLPRSRAGPPGREGRRGPSGPTSGSTSAGRPAGHIAEWYFERRFPALLSDPGAGGSDLIFSEFLLRESAGEGPEVREYLDRFPQFADRIRLQAAFHQAARTRPRPFEVGRVRPPPPRSGSRDLPSIPGYEILRQLGVGGMGVVYEAYQLGLKRRVALKMVLAGPRDGPERDARFQKEAEAAARLHHPNIAEIYEIGEFEGRPYFTLELVEGGDLANELGAGPMTPRRAAQLSEALARAMHYAHERGIVHRDLKPSNVLLTPDGVPKVADFGLAKHLEGDSDQTRSGTVLGSPCYMSPEQASGKIREVGREADVYSLGAILYEMLAGAPPFRSDTPLETLRKLLNEDRSRRGG